jgi:hypothetical protein
MLGPGGKKQKQRQNRGAYPLIHGLFPCKMDNLNHTIKKFPAKRKNPAEKVFSKRRISDKI